MSNKPHAADVRTQFFRAIEAEAGTRAALPTLLSCSLLILILGALLCFTPARTYSREEKRTLAKAPVLSLTSLAGGAWMAGIADFCADQFPMRPHFVAAKAATEIALGKQENNGILKGKDGYLIPRDEYREEQVLSMTKNMDAVSRFSAALAEREIPFTVAIVPRSIDVNSEKLPARYDTSIAQAAWERITQAALQKNLPLLDLSAALTDAADTAQVWFKTDHHWTVRGAYTAYVALGEALGYTPYPWQAFDEQVVYEDFKGTSYTAFGGFGAVGERLPLARFAGDEDYLTEILVSGEVVRALSGFYDWDALGSGDEYRLFLGGTNTCIRVTRQNREDAPCLVLIKDSFSQSIAPFLARHFDLLLLDPRTYDIRLDGAMIDRMEQAGADHVLLLYGIDTLYESPSLAGLTYGLS